ncbi:hypothetical protein ONS95_013393 [Cadophora gregata]|uniref:uncharacterized protein n=1 Tax=Cadophora gregata TaxID=51156 RepID=UPI0026DDC1B9|nr:uncharacterized protein ONS95_013393 [Cadophora gregata]KAK0099714.1 hypothetical protein ONS96_008211 [Cadophora gregata f. sp. sojae]KAK0116373.1 hypothetical protein ONS95_013393 [Cadophora gregata]
MDSEGQSDPEAQQDLQLLDDYLEDYDVANLGPSMRAARQPDDRILRAVLELSNDETLDERLRSPALSNRAYYRANDSAPRSSAPPTRSGGLCSVDLGPHSIRYCPEGVGITSPLMEAIRARLPDNVEMLLNAGADPNGVPLWASEMYAALFLRFRPAVPSSGRRDGATRATLLHLMDLPQVSTLTREEVEDRFYEGVAPFWCEEGFVPLDYHRHGESMPSLVEAARSGSVEIFDRLMEAGADRSFWMRPQVEVPKYPTSSSLSVSSPLHAALQTQDYQMLERILECGFDPNTMPLANPTRCFTPAMATIIYHTAFDKAAFDFFCQQPNIDLEIRTPVYGVHILHFAVATLDIDLLKHVSARTPLRNAAETALGHTLLHITCMPANASQVQRHSELICKSINESRDLRAQNDVFSRHPYSVSPGYLPDDDSSEEDLSKQTAMVKYLWGQGIQNLAVQDVHGNTALHYLAGCKDVNWDLISWWWEHPGVTRIWQETNNRSEASPEDLAHANQWARNEEEREPRPWKPWFVSWWKVGRERRKRAIWKRLLGNDDLA